MKRVVLVASILMIAGSTLAQDSRPRQRRTNQPAPQRPAPASQPASKPAPAFETSRIVRALDKLEQNKPRLDTMAFSTTALDGQSVVVPNDYHGKLVLVIYWATWCPKCAAELPRWKDAYARFGDEIAFVSVLTDKNRNRSEATVRQALAERGAPWEHTYDDGQTLSEQFEVATIPELYLIDGDTGHVLVDGPALRADLLIPRLGRSLAQWTRTHPPAGYVAPASQPASSQPASKPAADGK